MIRLRLLLLIAVLGCALSVVAANHRARKAYTQLEAEQKRMRDLEVEFGQLQLEQSTWASHMRVEKIAKEKLGMRPPAAGQSIVADHPAAPPAAKR